MDFFAVVDQVIELLQQEQRAVLSGAEGAVYSSMTTSWTRSRRNSLMPSDRGRPGRARVLVWTGDADARPRRHPVRSCFQRPILPRPSPAEPHAA